MSGIDIGWTVDTRVGRWALRAGNRKLLFPASRDTPGLSPLVTTVTRLGLISVQTSSPLLESYRHYLWLLA